MPFDLSLSYHQELNPKLWIGDKLKDTVRGKLLAIGIKWADYAKIPDKAIIDYILTGGSAGYLYNQQSDMDVHVLTNKKLLGNADYLDEYLSAKKQLWTLTHHVTVEGYPVELYAQDVSEAFPSGQGVYSLTRSFWLQRPNAALYDPTLDPALTEKAQHYLKLIDDMIAQKAPLSDFHALKKRLASMRGNAIAAGGEYALKNLVFKSIRNHGGLDRMNQYVRDIEDNELSLK